MFFFYMGGVLECLIGVIRWIIDLILMDFKYIRIIYEVFSMFMVEVIVIVNVCLLVFVFIDFEVFCVLFLVVLFI